MYVYPDPVRKLAARHHLVSRPLSIDLPPVNRQGTRRRFGELAWVCFSKFRRACVLTTLRQNLLKRGDGGNLASCGNTLLRQAINNDIGGVPMTLQQRRDTIRSY